MHTLAKTMVKAEMFMTELEETRWVNLGDDMKVRITSQFEKFDTS